MIRICLSAFVLVAAIASLSAQAEKTIRVTVWDEQQPAQKKAYENFLGNAIADHLKKKPEFRVVSANITQPEKGLADDVLNNTDVLVWWGHVRHGEISPEMGKKIVERIKRGQLSLIALHSAHWSTPFVEAMNERTRMDAKKKFPDPADGPAIVFDFVPPKDRSIPGKNAPLTPTYTPVMENGKVVRVKVDLPRCVFPAYRADGKPSVVSVLKTDHPIAKGLPTKFEIPQTEMYSDPFHVPEPDDVIFEEKWAKGESFRSGSVWNLGKGKVFYFRPGHETYPVYRQDVPLQVIENAVRWLGS